MVSQGPRNENRSENSPLPETKIAIEHVFLVEEIQFWSPILVFGVCKLYISPVLRTKWSFQLPPLPVSKSLTSISRSPSRLYLLNLNI